MRGIQKCDSEDQDKLNEVAKIDGTNGFNKFIDMKTWTSKLISGILMALLLMLVVQEESFAQFQMGNTLAPLTGNSYPIIFTNDSKGGHHQVATIADRNSITTLRRQPGMLCTVMDDGNGKTKTYQLICADIKADRDNNANWVVFASTGGNSTTPSGNSWLYGVADPSAANGITGDFYLNTTNNTVFGPKKSDDTWPALQLQGSPTGAAGGDLSGLYPNPVIAEKVISTGKIADGAVTTEKLIDAAVSTGKIADGAITTEKLGDKVVTTANITDQAVGTAQLKAGLADQVLVTNTAGTAVVWINKTEFLSAVDDITLTGAGTVANPFKVKDLGILTAHLTDEAVTETKLASDAVTTVKVKNAAITEEKLADDAVSNIKIKDEAVTETKLATDVVTTLKVKNAAVTEEKLADDAVSSIKIKDGSVTETKLVDGAITEGKLAAGAVSGDKVKDGAITEIKLIDGAVTEPKIATGAVTTDKLAIEAVTTEKIKDGAVSSGKIADGAVTTAKLGEQAVATINIADQAVGTEQLKTGLADQVLVTNTAGTSVVWINKSEFLSAVDNVTLTGAGTAANPFKVKDLGILTSHLAEGAVTEAKLSADAVTTLKVKNAAVTEEKLANDAVSSIKIKDGAVTETKLVDGAITEGKLAAGAVSGDKVKDGAITEIKLVDGAVTEPKIATGAVTTGKLAVDAVVTEKIKDGAVSAGKIVDAAITTAKLGDKAVTTINIADQAVGTEQLKTGLADQVLVTNTAGTSVVWINKSEFLSAVDNVTLTGAGTAANPFKVKDLGILTSHLAEGAVTEAKLSADAVTTLKIKNAAVTEEKLADDAVSNMKIKDGAVTETKLIDGAVTETKIGLSAVTTDKLAVEAVSTDKIKDGAVSTEKIADASITTTKLGDKVVTTANIADNSITPFKMQAGGANMVLVTDPSGASVIWVDKSALASVVDMETIIGNGTVGDAFQIKDTGIITRKIADLAVTTEKIADQAVSSIKLGDKAITTEKIADKAVTVAQIKEGTANQILTTNAEGAVAWADNTGGTETPTTFNGSRAITGDYYKGVNPNTNDIAKWLEAVFYPSTVPTVSIVPTPGLGTREMGSAGTNTVSLKWTATRVAGTAEIKQVTVDGVVVSTTTPAENASITGTTTGTVTNNTSKSFTVVATTVDGKTASASTSVAFQWKIYYGFITGGDDGIAFNPTDAQILGLSGSDFGTSKALKKQVTPSGSQKLVIAYPSSWGDAAILAGVNDSTGAFDKTTRSFTNASGGTTSYLIYVQKDNTAAGYQVTVQ